MVKKYFEFAHIIGSIIFAFTAIFVHFVYKTGYQLLIKVDLHMEETRVKIKLHRLP